MSDSLGFQITDVGRLLRRHFDERACQIGVTRPQWRLLLTLSRQEGINQGRLAELLEVEPITLSRMVDRLADQGLVERRADARDRRAWRIHLTEASHPILTELRAIGEQMMAEATAGLTPTQHAAIADGLARVGENLRSSNAGKVRANG